MPLVRVASVPAGHVYVRHLSDPDGSDGVIRLRDIPPVDGQRVPGGWWPPAMLDAAWVESHCDEFDVFHVHFGFDAKRPEELQDVVGALQRAGIPLVVTVHDLRNPHHPDPELHDEQLAALISGASALVTLTSGAAREIAFRWGRTAQVLAHPHVVGWQRMTRPRHRADAMVVGLHAKSIRSNMDVLGVADALVEAVERLAGTRLRIDLHDEVFDPDGHFYAPAIGAHLRALAREHRCVELREHPYFSEDELWDYLSAIDVSVLKGIDPAQPFVIGDPLHRIRRT